MSRAGALSSIGSSPARLAVLRSPVASARLGCRVFFLAFMLSSLSCSFFLVFYHLPPVCKKMKRTRLAADKFPNAAQDKHCNNASPDDQAQDRSKIANGVKGGSAIC